MREANYLIVTQRIGSIDKAERLLGFRATLPLREGLQSVVDWRLAQRAEKVGQ